MVDAGSVVRSIVLNDLKKIESTLKIGEFRNRVVMVDDYRLQYIVFRLENGALNIGRIQETLENRIRRSYDSLSFW